MTKTLPPSPKARATDGWVAAQVHRRFFERSETFLHAMTSGLRIFRPVYLAWEFANLDQFPVPDTDRFTLAARPGTWRWAGQGIGRRILGRELPAERFLKRRGARLLHAHFGPNGVWALRLKHSLGLPLVTTFYGYDMSQAQALDPRHNRYQDHFAQGDLFLVEGPFMRRRLVAIGCAEEKTAIQRIALPLSRLPFRPRLPKSGREKTVILFSGRFVEKKGILPALEAIRGLRRTHESFEFRVIGDGPLKAEVERFVGSRGMAAYVRLLGFVDHAVHLQQMQEADIFLQPSRTAADGDSEGGAPTTLLEAQALGLPVVSTTHADIPYVVVPGRSALLSHERDVAALTANLERLLASPEHWRQMGEAGRAHVEAHHDAAREIPRLEDLYRELALPHGG